MSLLRQVGGQIAIAIEPDLTRCLLHGYQPAVPACACVLAGEPQRASSMSAVLCGACLECHYEDELVASCFRCLLERGLLPALEGPDSIGVSPMATTDPADLAFDIDPQLDVAPAFMRYRARPDAD